jgi:DNA mismatch repair protein MutL
VTSSGRMRAPIRRLSAETIERIAAGEVVERPASVVKELVENSVDAGATTVVVRLRDGGLRSIEVEDDGTGIPPEELELALERHATSKLAPEGPLDEIASLGFRGEALASIATVSRLRLASRSEGRESSDGIEVTGGASPTRFAGARAPGTTVEVRDLFFNTPARQKFLKRPVTEQLEVMRTLERLYLARPTVTLRLEAEGREVAVLPATRALDDAAAHVLGAKLLRDSFAVDGPIPGGTVRGVLGRPSTAAAHSTGLYLSVNGRSIVSRSLAQSVRAAFADHLPRTRFPIGVLELTIVDDRVDVNVHPTKREVRFSQERELQDELRRRVREALLAAPQVADGGEVRSDLGSARSPGPGPAPASRARIAPVATPEVQRRFPLEPSRAVAAERPAAAGRPRLRLLGCVDRLYWAAETDDGFVLIDQHAASERALYEAILRDGRLARQELVDPVSLALTAGQRATLGAEAEAVAASGYEVEPFGPETVRVRAVPSFRGVRARPDSLPRLLDELAEGGRPVASDGLRERRAATLACHAAIRAGDAVDVEELGRVLSALEGSPGASYACPHGRPIFVQLTRSRLDRWFLRTGT